MKKRPTDPFQLAKLIGDIATGKVKDSDNANTEEKIPTKDEKNK